MHPTIPLRPPRQGVKHHRGSSIIWEGTFCPLTGGANICSVTEIVTNLNSKMKIIRAIRTLVAGTCAVLWVTQLVGCRFAARTPFARRGLEIPSRRRLAGCAASGKFRHRLRAGVRINRSATWRGAPSICRTIGRLNCRSTRTADGSHGFKTLGPDFPTNSIAWYRRTFELPKSDSGKRIWLTFDGVFRDATVWVNGWCVRHHEGGYYPFREDITDVVHFGGRNTIAVRVDATKVRGLVLRRRGHLPPCLAGQDRAGGHRAGRDFCAERI